MIYKEFRDQVINEGENFENKSEDVDEVGKLYDKSNINLLKN
jgi:hypothetical protein